MLSKEWFTWKETLLVFLPTVLPDETKPKTYDQIRLDYIKQGIWEQQNKVVSIMKDIEVTLHIGCNDISHKVLIDELRSLDKEVSKTEKLWIKYQPRIPSTPSLSPFIEFLSVQKSVIIENCQSWMIAS